MSNYDNPRIGCMTTDKLKAKAAESLRINVQVWATEAALKDLEFAGDEPWKGINGEKRAHLTQALLFYARNAAARTFDALKVRGNLAKYD